VGVRDGPILPADVVTTLVNDLAWWWVKHHERDRLLLRATLMTIAFGTRLLVHDTVYNFRDWRAEAVGNDRDGGLLCRGKSVGYLSFGLDEFRDLVPRPGGSKIGG